MMMSAPMYRAPPKSSVSRSPRYIAKKIAAAEPRTLEAALSDQAQRTEGLWKTSNRANPCGKGMPMQKPAGAINSTVSSIFTGSGRPTSAVVICDAEKASMATRTLTRPRARMSLLSSSPMYLPLKKLPQPLATSMLKMMTVSA